MFLKSIRWYGRDGSQHAKGPFLLLFCTQDATYQPQSGTARCILYAAVRTVQLDQLGHFMMGETKIGGHKVTLSGAYGEDGLPIDLKELPEECWDRLTPVPLDLCEAFWGGGGWNSAGAEAPAMVEWANENLKQLRR